MAFVEVNPALDPNTPLYDPVGGQSNVATASGFVLADANNIKYAPAMTEDRIRALIINGQGFTATTGQLSTATNTNVYIAVGIAGLNIAKNIFIYHWDGMLVQVYGDLQMTVAASFDATVATAITPLNDSRGSTTTPLAVVKSTAPANTTPAATSGTLRRAYGSAANLGITDMIKMQNGIWILAGQTQVITAWVKAPVAGNTGMFNLSWVEL